MNQLLIVIVFASSAVTTAADFKNTRLIDLPNRVQVKVLTRIESNRNKQHLIFGVLKRTQIPGVVDLRFSETKSILNLGDRFETTLVRFIPKDGIVKLSFVSPPSANPSVKDGPLDSIVISDLGDKPMTVADFNKLASGELELVEMNASNTQSESEGKPISQISLPSKIRFEEALTITADMDRLVYTHPKKPHITFEIIFNESLDQDRFIAKGSEFEILSLTNKGLIAIGYTTLKVNSKDIYRVVGSNSYGHPFTTTDFYEIMGSKASLIQNTDPPLPIE